MNYTTEMIADPNLSHVGFWFVVGIITLLFTPLTMDILEDPPKTSIDWFWVKAFIALYFAVIAFSAYQSFFRLVPVPLNKPVIATLVAEYESDERTGGKYPKNYIGQNVVYKTPDGTISFRRQNGVVYAEQVVLYKQK